MLVMLVVLVRAFCRLKLVERRRLPRKRLGQFPLEMCHPAVSLPENICAGSMPNEAAASFAALRALHCQDVMFEA